ncbi:MAG: cytochrome P460 family protein [Chromatiaceae bacterium]|nr:cytochrome P460 family protein [Chromatiaceae bacterium]
MRKSLLTLAVGVSLGALTTLAAADEIDYPDGYRSWTHVKSMTIHKGHPLETPFLGIHHVYANERALHGLQSKHFADGAMLVFDQLQSEDAGAASVEGDRVLIGVMLKDNARFPQTNGWGYQAWPKDSRSQRLVDDGGLSCHGCHIQQKDRDYVFSQWRD